MNNREPPDPSRIDELRAEIEAQLDELRGTTDGAGPTLDAVAKRLDELISLAKSLEATGREVSPKTKVALWHLSARVAVEILKRIVSATHNCRFIARRGDQKGIDARRPHIRWSYPRPPFGFRYEAA